MKNETSLPTEYCYLNLIFLSVGITSSAREDCGSHARGSFIRPNAPAGTSSKFSQLHISIMNPSGSFDQSVEPSSSFIVRLRYLIFISLSLFSIAPVSSHYEKKKKKHYLTYEILRRD